MCAERAAIVLHDTNLPPSLEYTRKDGSKGEGWDNEHGVSRAVAEFLGFFSCSIVQCVVVCVAACCSVLRRVVNEHGASRADAGFISLFFFNSAMYCSVCYSVLQRVAACCSVL